MSSDTPHPNTPGGFSALDAQAVASAVGGAVARIAWAAEGVGGEEGQVLLDLKDDLERWLLEQGLLR